MKISNEMQAAFISEMEKISSDLTAKGRSQVKEKNFALPEQRRYPIHDESHARAALSMVAAHGSPDEKSRVRSAVARKYPGISQTKEKDAGIMQNLGKPVVWAGRSMSKGVADVQKAMGICYTRQRG